MAVVIALLRGINVGGHRMIKMDALSKLCGSLGCKQVQTYVQSGNVVFQTDARDMVRLGKRLADELEHTFGFRPVVILRTPLELKEVIRKNPFARRKDIEPGKLLVTFFANDPGAEARERLLKIKTDPEELRIEGREVYVHYPNGVGRSKLSAALVEKTLGIPGTGRNWNTVRKLLEMAEKLEG